MSDFEHMLTSVIVIFIISIIIITIYRATDKNSHWLMDDHLIVVAWSFTTRV